MEIAQLQQMTWNGNYHNDSENFKKCHDFIMSSRPSRADKLEAMRVIDSGMGIQVDTVTEEELDRYMEEYGYFG